MKKLNISNKVIIIATIPALVLSLILSTYYINNQFNYISDSLRKHGEFIARQLAPGAEYAIFSGNTELISPLINSVIKNKSVLRVQIVDKNNHLIFDTTKHKSIAREKPSLLKDFLEKDRQLVFTEPVIPAQVYVGDYEDATSALNEASKLGDVIVTLTTRYATEEKIKHIKNAAIITIGILFISTLIIVWRSRALTRPLQHLTESVRNIAAGNLDTKIEVDANDEIGVLQSCINHMTSELKLYQTDMESQLDQYTSELQQTLEELEIRNAELDITRSKAIYANNAKSEFLANMSHEIRTPLSGIIGFAELLQGTELSAQQKDYSSTIQKSSKKLLEIINDILDLSKIESGKTEITRSEFNLVDIIEDIIILLSQTALEKDIELFYRIEQDVPETINSDPFRIHQILMNLIGNAIKFTDSGYVYLQITTDTIKENESSIKFTISDTGIGMSTDDKKKLFKAFTQADTSITRRFGGTGLGLVISRKLTLLMKGEIGFDSTEGEGSTFWFSIPVTAVSQEARKDELKNRRIAFFSNHFIARQAFNTLFSNWQCQVENYAIDDLDRISDIEKDSDMVVLVLSRKDINSDNAINKIHNTTFTIPSLLIASTRSHSQLRNLQQHTFDTATFTSEKADVIKQKSINLLGRNTSTSDADDLNMPPLALNNWSSVNVMVVDDNEVNLRLVEIILHKHKTRVTTARSGAQAIDYACMSRFDIIFMDLHMPGLDGYETTKRIREIAPGKQPVIIALTANAMPQDKEKVIESGMNGILIKPVSDAILQKVIHQWVLKKPDNPDAFIKAEKSATEKNTDNDKIFSLAIAREFTGNNEELAHELFAMLRSELDDYVDNISSAAKNRNLEALREHVHKLHGASRCCGTSELKQASSHIENLINKKINFDIDAEVASLLAAIKRVADYKIQQNS